jgi:2-hydroxychromene-2-carboxylate isomerase
MSKNLEFLFDFGGPNSYLAYKMLPDLCARTGAKVVYVPILLGGLFKLTNNQAPMMRYAETPAKQKYEMLEFQRFVNAHAIPFKMNPRFPLNTLYVMRGAIAAQRLGCFAPYMDAVMAAMWHDAADMGDLDVVRDVLDKAGLDSTANTEAAAKRGAFGVPTFFVDDEMFWGKERLGQVEAALTKS